LIASVAAAFWAMAIQTGVINQRFALAAVALVNMSAQRRRSTSADITKSPELAVRQR